VGCLKLKSTFISETNPLSKLIPNFQTDKKTVYDEHGNFVYDKILPPLNLNNVLPFNNIKKFGITMSNMGEIRYYILLNNGELYEFRDKDIFVNKKPNVNNGESYEFRENKDVNEKLVAKNIKDIISVYYEEKLDLSRGYTTHDYIVRLTLLNNEGKLSVIDKDKLITNIKFVDNIPKIVDSNYEENILLDSIQDTFSFNTDSSIFSGRKDNIIYMLKYKPKENIMSFTKIDYDSIRNDRVYLSINKLSPLNVVNYKIIMIYSTQLMRSITDIYVINSSGNVDIIDLSQEIPIVSRNELQGNFPRKNHMYVLYQKELDKIFIIYCDIDKNAISMENISTHSLTSVNIYILPKIKIEECFDTNNNLGRGPIFLDDEGTLYEFREAGNRYRFNILDEKLLGIVKILRPLDKDGYGVIYKKIIRGKYVLFPYALYLLYLEKKYIVTDEINKNEIYFTITNSTYNFRTVIGQ